jgi:hypothetical protein
MPGGQKLRPIAAVPPACAANCAVIVSARDAPGDTGQNCDRGICAGNHEYWPVSSQSEGSRLGLANRRLRPLGHLTARLQVYEIQALGRNLRSGGEAPPNRRRRRQIPAAECFISVSSSPVRAHGSGHTSGHSHHVSFVSGPRYGGKTTEGDGFFDRRLGCSRNQSPLRLRSSTSSRVPRC